MQGLNFIAIDFEIATGKRASICEAGICIVRDGKIAGTRSWLVRPEGNYYSAGASRRQLLQLLEHADTWHSPPRHGGCAGVSRSMEEYITLSKGLPCTCRP